MESEFSASGEDSLLSISSEDERLLLRFRKKELLFKILVIGDYGVGKAVCVFWKFLKVVLIYFKFLFSGKTSIIRRYADGK